MQNPQTIPLMKPKSSSTILVVEDDAAIRHFMFDYFSEYYTVVSAVHGADALEKLRLMTELPCIVFLDLMMPIMNGWQFLDVIHNENLLPGVRIVVMTAAAKSEVPHNVSFVEKPMDLLAIEKFCEASCQVKFD